jgi:hypothetical protein
MRDIYNREKKLKTWTERIMIEFEECDRADTFKFVEYKREREEYSMDSKMHNCFNSDKNIFEADTPILYQSIDKRKLYRLY